MRTRTLAALLSLVFVPFAQSCQGSSFWREALNIDRATVDFTALRDGEYIGECDRGVKARVRVFVLASRVAEIEILEHGTVFGKKAEGIVDTIVELQTLDVDTVSGATLSSLVLLEAVGDALEQSPNGH